MNTGRLKKWILTGLLTVLFIMLAGIGWVEYQLRRFAGEYTQVVDRKEFASPQLPLLISNVSALSPDGTTMLESRFILLDQGKIQSVSAESPPNPGYRDHRW